MTSQPPAPNLGPGPSVLAIDVGGTQFKAALLGTDGRLAGVRRRPTPRSGNDPGTAIVAAAADLLDELRAAGNAVDAVGITVPGIVDESRGVGIRSTNLGWRDYPFGDRLADRTGLPCVIAHDVRAAGEAEARLGAARGAQDAAIVTIGTGIAAALRIAGSAYTGGGYAGELGHVVVDPSGPACACGRTGCLEAIASAAAIARRYRELGGDPVSGAADVVARVSRGDAVAILVWESALAALGTGLSLLVAVMAPQVIVVGGGLSEAGPILLDPLRTQLAARCIGLAVPRLVRAELGEDAGTWGAAALARDAAARAEGPR